MSVPSISVRLHLRQIPGEAEEPTSTLVLTSHKSHYVDLRIFKPRHGEEPELPNEGGPMDRLDWAFAGTSHATPGPKDRGDGEPWHSAWEHWVDSRSDHPPPDEGDMWPQPNGDILEKGSSRDPKTGVVSEYEELWADLPVDRVGGEAHFISAVLRLQDDERNARGMVVRVGGWCQGLLKIGNDVTLERWKWVPKGPGLKADAALIDAMETDKTHDQVDPDDVGDWVRVARLGVGFLPCAVTFNPVMAKEGTVIEAGDASWKVVEKYQW